MDDKVLDYRVRMWLDDGLSVPNGLFSPSEFGLVYTGRFVNAAISSEIYSLLTTPASFAQVGR